MTMSTDDMASVAANVKRLRNELGLSQEDLASRAGHSRYAVVSIEAGKPARASTVRHFAEALGVTLAQLRGQEPTSALPPIDDQPRPPGVEEDDYIRELRARIKMHEADAARYRDELRKALGD